MSKLPEEGVVGTNLDATHCIAAAVHAAASTDFTPTEAQKVRIERGQELLVQPSIRSLV